MVSQLWHAAPGPLLSSLLNSWLMWNGGAPTIISYVPTERFEWHSYSPKSEVADFWYNAIASVLQPWQRAERTDDGQQERSSVIPCRRSHAQPVESP